MASHNSSIFDKIQPSIDTLALGIGTSVAFLEAPQRIIALSTRASFISSSFINNAFHLAQAPIWKKISRVAKPFGVAALVWNGGRTIENIIKGEGTREDYFLLGGLGVALLGSVLDLPLLIGIATAINVTDIVLSRVEGHSSNPAMWLQLALTILYGFDYQPKNPGRFRLKTVTPEHKQFISEEQVFQNERQANGIIEYARSIFPQMDPTDLKRQLGVWQRAHGKSLNLPTHGELSNRAKILLIKREALAKQGRSLAAYELEGTPDQLGNSVKIHIERHQKMGAKPKGHVFLIPGYGETVAQYDFAIAHFLEKDFGVIAVDQRGHGLSGHPLGLQGYMDSGPNAMRDLNTALKFSHSLTGNKPLFAFGFSQSALFQTRLAQNHPAAFKAMGLISPTHQLGRRFQFVNADHLDGNTLDDFAQLKLDHNEVRPRNMRLGRIADLPDSTRVIFGRSPLRVLMQEWQDWGFSPRWFVIQDSSVVWRELIDEALVHREHHPPLKTSLRTFAGRKDDNIRGETVFDQTHYFFEPNKVESTLFPGKDHQLLLYEDIRHGILEEISRFFGGFLS